VTDDAAVQFARNFYLAQWYHECSLAISKSSGTSAETASVASESASANVPQSRKKKKKKNRHQSDDGETVDTTSSPVATELKQMQLWLLGQMQTGLASADASRCVFSLSLYLQLFIALAPPVTHRTLVSRFYQCTQLADIVSASLQLTLLVCWSSQNVEDEVVFSWPLVASK